MRQTICKYTLQVSVDNIVSVQIVEASSDPDQLCPVSTESSRWCRLHAPNPSDWLLGEFSRNSVNHRCPSTEKPCRIRIGAGLRPQLSKCFHALLACKRLLPCNISASKGRCGSSIPQQQNLRTLLIFSTGSLSYTRMDLTAKVVFCSLASFQTSANPPDANGRGLEFLSEWVIVYKVGRIP